ncbi:CapA family protein [Streptomyces sp. NPDC050738]|uniref:CapA family protein n=1 Tax=Streptomyces sp. NPDC050738 TaxID=3154744 RepID=UPI00341FD0A7
MTKRTPQRLAAAAAVLLAAASACTARHETARPAPHHAHQDSERPASSGTGGGAAALRGFTLVATGDVLPHTSIIERAHKDAHGRGYDFRPMLAAVKPLVTGADLAICHMETVYGAKGGPYTGWPTFKSPPQVAAALAATGYDSCSAASNHTLDDGPAGIRRTLGALDAAGVAHTGSGRTAAESERPAWLKGGSAKVAQLAYTYDTNGFPQPEGQPWAVHLIDEQQIVADARAARTAGADVVVVSIHWGTEWQDTPNDQQLTLGRALTASKTAGRPDIDLILGTHAHVPQAYEKVNGTWIIYGMGDQIAGEMYNPTGAQDDRGNESSIGRFTFTPPAKRGGRWTVTKAEFVPQWMDLRTGRVVNLPEALRGHPKRADYRAAQSAIRTAVLSRGAAADGLTMAGK